VITTKITRIVEEPQVEAEVTGSVADALFGLGGFRVLAAADAGGELEVLVETPAGIMPCLTAARWRGPRIAVRCGYATRRGVLAQTSLALPVSVVSYEDLDRSSIGRSLPVLA
jgi:hypothetical protein